MKFLIRLYPKAWRARYGAEFEALLQQERPGVAAVLNIVATALSLRVQDIWAGIRDAGIKAYGTFRLLPRGGGFAMAMAVMGSMAGLSRSGYAIPRLGLFIGTLAVIALKLLHQTGGEREGHRARVALMVILFAALPLYFVGSYDGQFPVGAIDHFQPSLIGLILAIGARENAWPTLQRLRVMGVVIWASGLQSLTLFAATAIGLITPTWGFAFSALGSLMTVFFVRERRRLALPAAPSQSA